MAEIKTGKVLRLCNGWACLPGTKYCAVMDPEHYPDGCRHTASKLHALHPKLTPEKDPEQFEMYLLKDNKTAALCFVEKEESKTND